MDLSRLRNGSTLPLAAGRATAFAAAFFLPVVLARLFPPAVFGTYKQILLLQMTLYGIAQRFHTGVDALLAANRLAANTVLQPGLKLRLP